MRSSFSSAGTCASRKLPPASFPRSRKIAPRAKLTYNETRELAALPDAIAALEQEIADIESALADPTLYAADSARAKALTARLPQAREELDAAETRWLELSERA